MQNAVFGEFIGTFVLLAFGVGINAATNLNRALAKNNGATWLMVCLGWGLAVTFGVYASGFFGAPGHLNPAVTLGQLYLGSISGQEALGFIGAQMLGAFLGAVIIFLHYYPHFEATPAEEGNGVGIFATGPAIPSTFWNLFSEICATFLFVLAINTLGSFTEGLQPFIVGLLVVAVGLSFGSTTGFAINPARDLGPRLAYQLLPVPHKGSANWSYAWVPIVGPIVGALLACLVTGALA